MNSRVQNLSHFAIQSLWVGMLTLPLLSACSSVQVWPFDGKSSSSSSHTLAGASHYQCAAGKDFYLRLVDNGANAWLIYPDREVFLTRDASGKRYSNGVAVLDLANPEATLNDGKTIAYSACKVMVEQ